PWCRRRPEERVSVVTPSIGGKHFRPADHLPVVVDPLACTITAARKSAEAVRVAGPQDCLDAVRAPDPAGGIECGGKGGWPDALHAVTATPQKALLGIVVTKLASLFVVDDLGVGGFASHLARVVHTVGLAVLIGADRAQVLHSVDAVPEV